VFESGNSAIQYQIWPVVNCHMSVVFCLARPASFIVGLELDTLLCTRLEQLERPLSAEPPFAMWRTFAICLLIHMIISLPFLLSQLD